MAKSKNWCFTLNNYTEEDIKDIALWECKGVAYGKEVGENGTPHLQGFVCFKNQVRFQTVKDLHAKAHWEIMHGRLDQNKAYCSKQGELTIHGKNIHEDPGSVDSAATLRASRSAPHASSSSPLAG